LTSRNIIEMRDGLEDLVPIGMRTCLKGRAVDRYIKAHVHQILLQSLLRMAKKRAKRRSRAYLA
jgi:hypothetical protein